MNETSGLRVSVDVGCYQHSVAVGLSDGTLLDEFDLSHEPAGFDLFFERIDRLRERHGAARAGTAQRRPSGGASPFD